MRIFFWDGRPWRKRSNLKALLNCSIASPRGEWLNGQLSQLVNSTFWTIFPTMDSISFVDFIPPNHTNTFHEKNQSNQYNQLNQ